tara:strand:+ start:385 stop:2133 length:1749 start_codon:yes stop_codon:yes gene_type:complete
MHRTNIINSIYNLYRNIDFKRKLQLVFLIIFNLLNGILEFITLSSASLFLESLINPDSVIKKLKWTNLFYEYTTANIVLNATLIFILFITLSTILRISNLWISMKFRVSLLVYLEEKIFKNIIYQELDYHINTSSTKIINDLTKNIDKANFFIENLLSLITCIILSISLVIGLINLSFSITVFTITVLSILYIIIGIITSKKVKIYGKYELKSNQQFLQIIQESLGAIKEIILRRKHNFFLKKYNEASYISRKYQGLSGFVTTFPRYLFEGIGLIVIGIAGYIVFSKMGTDIIPLIGTFALGAQKLLPSMQTVYRSWQLLYFYDEGLKRILKLIKLNYREPNINKNKKIKFRKEIYIKNLFFKYNNSNSYSLENINLLIKKGENIGIMGITGSGKTTFINILMGLLKPSEGSVYVDGKNIFEPHNIEYLFSWRKNINHVPQKIYLTNSTLVNNIALGISKSQLDFKKINFSIRKSCLEELVKQRNNDIFLLVGEDGVKLSGGQKQRIGIARAIYNDLDILILDESTNALDHDTEKEIMQNIYNLPNKKTTITISHSKSALLACDKIIEFRKGRIYKITSKKI